MPRRKGDDLDDFIVPDDEVEESEDSDVEEPLCENESSEDEAPRRRKAPISRRAAQSSSSDSEESDDDGIPAGYLYCALCAKPVVADNGKKFKLVDGLSVAQGPNYALAKRMQHWRAQIEYEAGATVSSMVAPSTATISVIHNKTFAWAYGGMPYFRYEIFKQETTNAVMAAMLMHDTLNTATPKNPANRAKFGIDNSLELFSTQAVHGGLWRSPYTVDSLGYPAALIYFAGLAAPYLAALSVMSGGLYAYFVLV